jgi:hypothetical protein
VVPFRDDKSSHVIVTHENITPIIEIQKELEAKEVELRSERERLEETNIALRVLRQKLGLTNSFKNLRSYLLALERDIS